MEFLNNLIINIANGLVWLISMIFNFIQFSYGLHLELINQYDKYPYAVVFIGMVLFIIFIKCMKSLNLEGKRKYDTIKLLFCSFIVVPWFTPILFIVLFLIYIENRQIKIRSKLYKLKLKDKIIGFFVLFISALLISLIFDVLYLYFDDLIGEYKSYIIFAHIILVVSMPTFLFFLFVEKKSKNIQY